MYGSNNIYGVDADAIQPAFIQALEKNMCTVKASMEKLGLNVNIAALLALINQVDKAKENLRKKLSKVFGSHDKVNFNSARDIASILSSELGIELKKSKTGRFIANCRALTDFNNPLTKSIARYRNLEKILSSLRGLYEAADKEKGKVFCVFTDDCPSGRLYTKNYNVQGIPEIGRRAIYSDKNHSFVLADYESFELRILSALACDKYFKECWAKGLDLHRKVVADMKNTPYKLITDKERKLGKALNFGLSYGQEPHGLARNLGIAVHQAKRLMETYKNNIPAIEKFKKKAIAKARLCGFAATYFGRKRFLPDIISLDTSDRKKAERQTINHEIQGTASDIVKMGMVQLHKEGFIINTMVHDSILLTIPDDKIIGNVKRIKEIMEIEIENMKFPIVCKVGKTWGDCH